MMKFKPEMLKIYLVIGTQNVSNSEEKLLEIVEKACKSGVTTIQFREKDGSLLNYSEKVTLGKKIHEVTQRYEIPLFVDDDFELASAISAEGIHVGQSDERVFKIRQQNKNIMIGLSIHSLSDLAKSRLELKDCDYVGIGPLFKTSSKSDAQFPIGMAKLEEIVQKVSLPTVAIGGINLTNISQLKNSQINGVAVISAITQSSNIEATVQTLKRGGEND
ncbi:thiamine phosphate synthase [Fructilactobacillus vespulae]|uniref:thiamine phosphate synthase n=1 Tax=Fructilactobacillus vespulae TaxID=1249630 RepID=UPI0039B36731